MLKNDKLLQIYNSFKYRSFHPYKYFFLKNRYKKIRIKTFEKLSKRDSIIKLSQNKSFKIFSQYKNEFILLDKEFKEKKEQILDKYNVEIHAIHYPELIYFLIRKLKPQSVIETGVWLGLSSQYILSAGIKNHNNFKLDSIDLPRFNLTNSKNLIGLFVSKSNKNNWTLHIGTDRQKLKKLLKTNSSEVFLFDSDKTHRGKMYLYNTVKRYRDNYIMIFDDVEDNLFWFDKKMISENKILINYQNKYVGIIFSDKYKSSLRMFDE
tara:strand:+ start:370 stop:1164 length:795 start_codon:yes stop_codon:yes gene_type:complete